uniref:Uncharacterized protein n=1 Tax=Arundo donax TaxID=35708 RepID=A0A0A9CFE3_ARUDO
MITTISQLTSLLIISHLTYYFLITSEKE